MLRVFVTHNPEDRQAYYGRALPELEAIAEVVLNPTDHDLATAELVEAAAGCQVIVSHRSTPGEAELFESSGDLVAFLRCAVDIRNVDVGTASRLGIAVGHAAKSFVASTAELALGLMIAAARSIGASTADYQRGDEPPQRPGRQLAGATAGIIGYGSIGTYLARLLAALDMRVLVHDPFVAVDDPAVVQVGFHELLAGSDFVFPLAPASEATADLIDATALAAMKHDAVLVNVSRGELVDEAALAAALDDAAIGGLAMDVGRAPDQRPTPSLAARPGVVATPHLGGLTPENADAQAASSVEQVQAILDGRVPPRLADPAATGRLEAWWSKR